MTLTNPINKQNIVNRFADFVVATANSGIVWGTNARPSPYFTSTYLGFEPFGGTTAGKSIATSAANITDTLVTASTIYNVLVQETQRYSNIRNLRARVNVTGAGGNTPLGPLTPANPGIVFDQTAKAHLSTSYLQGLGTPSNAGVASNQLVRSLTLESFFSNLRTQYNTDRDNTVTITVNVCHSSCHSSCHANRGRR
jgi:hypothetical protein